MVLGRSRLTTTKPVTALSLALVALSLMFVFSGGNGRRGGIIFVEASSGSIGGGGGGGVGGGGFWSTGSHSNVGLAVAVTAMAGLALAATVIYSRRGSLKSPWSRRRRKHALLPKQWKSLFDSDGRLCDGGVKFLKKVRSGGVDPSIRAEVWPFLLGMYELNSSKEERDSIRLEKRKEYDNLRKQCQLQLTDSSKSLDLEETSGNHCCEDSGDFSQVPDSPGLEDVVKPKGSICSEGAEDLGNSMCKGVVVPRGSISTEGAEDPGNSMCKDEVVSKSLDLEETSGNHCCKDSGDCSQVLDSPGLEEVVKPKGSIRSEGAEDLDNSTCKGVVIPRGSMSAEGTEDPGDSMCKDEVVSPRGSISAVGSEDPGDSMCKDEVVSPRGSIFAEGTEDPGDSMCKEEVVSSRGSIPTEGTEDPGDSMCKEEVVSSRGSIPTEGSKDPGNPRSNPPLQSSCVSQEGESGITCENAFESDSESSNSDDSEETENTQAFLALEGTEENNLDEQEEKSSSSKSGGGSKHHSTEDFSTWQRIIRLDAVRANAEWVTYSPSQAAVSETKARQLADSVGLKDYDYLEPSRIFHAARLIAILEAYTLYDSEIGYCQGMSDLLSPIIAVMEEDYEAFWCFVGFMRKARHNFRLDEVGIRRQLDIVSKIIKGKDSHLYNHLEKLQAEDCFFVYRMVVVLFRRELNFEQTLCLWEVMWADQAAIRAGIAKSAWGRMRLRAPPTDDLLLFAIAACVLQRRKLIVENYSSMDEIMRECNSMAGHLDVWKLLDDAHDLVVKLHDKI